MSEKATSELTKSRVRRTSRAARSGLDVMLSEAAAGGPPRFLAPGSGVKVGAGLTRRPRRLATHAAGLAAELARTAAGRSELAPAKGDRRFADPAWEDNWLLRRLLQGYLAVGDAVDRLISDAEVDWRAERRVRLAAGNVLDALAPTNFPWSNPAVLKETVNTGGENLVRGARRLVRDLSKPPRLPATVDTSKFEVGGSLAVSPESGGERRFVLSSSGHIQALVNPPAQDPAQSRSSFGVADELPESPDDFLAAAPKLPGSWWSDWDAWLAERSGELKPAPKALGTRAHKAHGKAPGTYVLAN